MARQQRTMDTASKAQDTASKVRNEPEPRAHVNQTFRETFRFRGHHGYSVRLPVGSAEVNRHSVVMVSVSELGVDGPFLGNASISVDNVSPNDAGDVWVRGNIGWESDLDVQFSVIIAN